jgi:hypothetical protein
MQLMLTKKQRMLQQMGELIDLEQKGSFFRVFVEMPDHPHEEMIENPLGNLAMKRKYYDSAYDDSLMLKTNPAVRIVRFQQVINGM